MADFKYTDTQGRKITQTAYDSQKGAGTDVSAYKPITSTAVQPTVKTPTAIAPVTPVAVSPVNQMDAIKKLPEYQRLINDKKYTPEQIESALASYKPAKPQVQPQAEVKPATPEVAPAQTPVQQQKPAEITPQQPANVPAKEMNQTGTMQLLAQSEYQDDSTDRMNNIVSNLNQYRQNAPQFMGNIDTFKANFAYDKRSDAQKKVLDTWYNGYKKGVDLSLKPTTDLVNGYSSGTLNPTDLDQLKMNDPNKYAEVMAGIEKKKVFENLKGELYGKEEPKTVMQQLDDANGDGGLFDEYKKVINGEEVKTLQTEIAGKQGQIKQLQLDMQTIANDVEKQYEGKGASRSKINAIIADQQEEINNKISALSIDADTVLNRYNSIVGTAKETMQLGIQQQEAERAQRNQKMSELGFYYQYDPKGMTERADTLFQIENPDINSTDPMTARRALNTELSKYYEQFGDIIIRPQSQALNDILAQSKAEGLSLSQALKKNFTDPLQAKNLYSAKLQKNMGLDFGGYQLTQSADGNWNMSTKKQATTGLTSGIQGSGNIAQVSLSGKNVGLDTVAAPSIQEAFSDPIMQGIVVGQGHRDQVATIKTMASKYGIAFNANNPAETAKKLSEAGHQVAAPGYSKHESGMAIDLYDKNGKAPSAEQVKILNSKGWYQTAGAGDMGHFEYTGAGTTGNYDQSKEPLYKDYLSNYKLPSAAALKGMGKTPEQFTKEAEVYKNSKGGSMETTDQLKEITSLRKEFNGLQPVKDYKITKQMYESVKAASNLKTAAGDLSLIFSYMKILDPNSTVREGEFANAQNAGGIDDRISNAYNKALKGTRLSDNQRKDFSNSSKTLFKTYEDNYNKTLDDYKTYAVLGGDVSRLGETSTLSQQESTGPKINFSMYGQGAGNVLQNKNTIRSMVK